jgi:hypothetical protein
MTPGEIALLMRIDAAAPHAAPDRRPPQWCCDRCSSPFWNAANYGMHRRACSAQPQGGPTKASEQFRGEAGVCLSRIGKAVSVDGADRR